MIYARTSSTTAYLDGARVDDWDTACPAQGWVETDAKTLWGVVVTPGKRRKGVVEIVLESGKVIRTERG